MSDNTLREACERLRAYYADMDASPDIYNGLATIRKHYPESWKREADAEMVIKAYLAEHPKEAE